MDYYVFVVIKSNMEHNISISYPAFETQQSCFFLFFHLFFFFWVCMSSFVQARTPRTDFELNFPEFSLFSAQFLYFSIYRFISDTSVENSIIISQDAALFKIISIY